MGLQPRLARRRHTTSTATADVAHTTNSSIKNSMKLLGASPHHLLLPEKAEDSFKLATAFMPQNLSVEFDNHKDCPNYAKTSAPLSYHSYP